jgi:hypothetical protein
MTRLCLRRDCRARCLLFRSEKDSRLLSEYRAESFEIGAPDGAILQTTGASGSTMAKDESAR